MSGGFVEIFDPESDDDSSLFGAFGVCEAVLETSSVGSCAIVDIAGRNIAAAIAAQYRAALRARATFAACTGADRVATTSENCSNMMLGLLAVAEDGNGSAATANVRPPNIGPSRGTLGCLEIRADSAGEVLRPHA